MVCWLLLCLLYILHSSATVLLLLLLVSMFSASLHSDCLLALGNVRCSTVFVQSLSCDSEWHFWMLSHVLCACCGSSLSIVREVLDCLLVSRIVSCTVIVLSSVFSHQPLHQGRNKNGCLIGERILLVCATLHTTTGAGAWLCCLASNRGSTLLVGLHPYREHLDWKPHGGDKPKLT